MKFIVCQQPGTFELKEKPAPQPKANEALLRVQKVGICGTDLHAYAGNQAFFTYPRILGHELACVVEEVDENAKGIRAGDKVVVMPYISCGTCIACRQGKTNCCTNIKVLGVHTDGGMQEQIVLPLELLIPLHSLGYDEMAIVEPLAIGAHAIERAQLQPREVVVVVGCGPIGIGIMKLAQLAGALVIAIDIDQGRLEYAKAKIGVDYAIQAGDNAVEQISGITNGDMATAVFDATGHTPALEKGPLYLAHGGRYVLVGLSKGPLSFHHPAIHAKEASIICSRNATLGDFEKTIKLLEEGKFPVHSYITHSVHYTEMIGQFDQWLNPAKGVIKATVNFN